MCSISYMIIYDIQCYNWSLEVKLQYRQMKQQRWEESEKRKEEIPKATTNVQRVNWQRLLGSKVFMPGALHIWPWEAASKTHFMQKVLTICMTILETDALLPSLWLFCLVVIHCFVLFCYSYSIVNSDSADSAGEHVTKTINTQSTVLTQKIDAALAEKTRQAVGCHGML